MSEPHQPDLAEPQGNLPQGFQIGSILATPIPAERTFPLRHDQFQILCLGMTSGATSGLFFCIGLLVSALAGLFTLFENADWPSFWAHHTRSLLAYFGFLINNCCWINHRNRDLLLPKESRPGLRGTQKQDNEPLHRPALAGHSRNPPEEPLEAQGTLK